VEPRSRLNTKSKVDIAGPIAREMATLVSTRPL
jgi:hypothetical protein